uniref:Uncharacterized protein n=1 Tax=Timema douglasi TaxID=61478 RepID=A0A7R8Z536_TIMDO|nr:unnamed protein product [Timema douglasi]
MGLYSSPMASLVLTDSSQLTSGSQHLDLQIHPTSPNGNALIAYDPKQHNSSKYWISNIESFLKAYTDPSLIPGRSEKKVNCDYDQPPQKDQVCDINIQYWSPCTAKNNYSYHRASPCIFLTFTQIEGWEPEFYSDVANLPVDMPTELKEHIEYIQRRKPLQVASPFFYYGAAQGRPLLADVRAIGALYLRGPSYLPQPPNHPTTHPPSPN